MTFLTKKSLGQNFLIDKKIIDKIIEVGDIKTEDEIIEVGPGAGALTEKIIAKKPKNLVVIEKDKNLVEILNNKFGKQVNIVNKDMMKFSYEQFLNKKVLVFGNLPYNISTQILAKWIKMKHLNRFCKKFILMFQKEVADRIIAETHSKNYGRLSIMANWNMSVDKIIDIEANSFKPSPKVKSTLLVFVPKKNFHTLKEPKNLEHVTNIFFTQRRKMIKKPMKRLFKNFEEIAKKLSLDLNLRPQNIDKINYYKICSLYEDLTN
tara:strand:+ start:321 stop:1112 length:792 start_codon:yes stop_codon:yes gene_type:complete